MKIPRFISGFIAVLLIFTITFQVVAFPLSVKRAEASAVDAILKDFLGDAAMGLVSCAATWGVSFAINSIMGLTTDVPSTDKNAISLFIKENCLKPMAKQIALGVLQKLTESTVNWINGGFNGNPFYVRDLGSYLTSVSDEAVRNISFNIKIGNSPYTASLSSGLINSYLNGQQMTAPAYTLNAFLGDVRAQAFNDGDFEQGGWNAWLASTVVSQNNSLGATIITGALASKEIARQQEINQQDLEQNDGFLSMKKCKETEVIDGEDICQKWETTTPGSMVADQLKESGKSHKDQLIATEDIVESVMSIFGALMQTMMTDGVSSASSGNYTGDTGGYGINDLDASSVIAGSGNGWTNAGGYTAGLINLDDIAGYRTTQNAVRDNTAILLPKVDAIIKKLYEADYCVPGPRPDWFEITKEKISKNMSDWVPDTKGGVVTWMQEKFGVTVDEPNDDDGHAGDVKKLTMRSLEGGPLKDTDTSYERGYKDFIDEHYGLIENIPIAFSIFKEFEDVEDYQILMNFNQDRSDQAYVFLTRLDYIEKEYNKLPAETDPTYVAKRKTLQEMADTLLVGIYKESVITGILGQIQDVDAKYLYLTNTDSNKAPLGLIPECVAQLVDYPTVAENRRPYPTSLLDQSVQDLYPSDNTVTFLPTVKVGPDAAYTPNPDGWILIDDYYNVQGAGANTPQLFEIYLGVY